VDLHFTYPEDIQHLKFNLNDCQSQDATHTFKPAFEWIENARRTSNVLVHCAAGISRCSTILIAYLLQKYKWTFDYSLKVIQERRPCCQPNTGFCKQLREFERKLNNQ
jgi:protein-tyrosine phosphatase